MIKAALPPGPRSWLPIREVRALQRDVIGFLGDLKRTYGDVSCFRVGPQLVYFVTHPDFVQDVLVTHHRSFGKTWLLRTVDKALGNGMINSRGEANRRKREMIMPALQKHRVTGYADAMIRIADRTACGWQDGATVDMVQEMIRLTMAIVTETLFGADIRHRVDDVARTIAELFEVYTRSRSHFWDMFERVRFLPGRRRFDHALDRLDATLYDLIERRRRSGEEKDDVLGVLLAARDENGRALSDRELRDEAIAMFLAGHETTTNLFAWFWYLLSQHPEVEDELHLEVDAVCADRLPRAEDRDRLPFMRKVLAESLRLYPLAYVIPRRVLEPCQLGQFTLRPGALLLLGVYHMHRDPRYFDEPDRFDPRRWTPEMKERLPRGAYRPFGAGPHSCPGEHFAWVESTLAMAVLTQRWKARVVPGHTVIANPIVFLRPRAPMPMILTRRQCPAPISGGFHAEDMRSAPGSARHAANP